MKIAATAEPGKRQEELGQFLTAKPVADFMASMSGPHPGTVRLLDAGTPPTAFETAIRKNLKGLGYE